MQYRTEIHIAADRYVCLQLPDFIPAGRATVTVNIIPPNDADEREHLDADERDHPDIEWWDEIDGIDPRRD